MLASSNAAGAPTDPLTRPAEWATPITLQGVGNLHQVNESLFRSQQPTREGFRNLSQELGIRTVINLRSFHSDRRKIQNTPLQLIEVEVNTWNIRDEDIIEVLLVLRWSNQGPFLVHCLHGADRTGTVNALYRVIVQGWSREQALKEMIDGGYGFHSIWKNILDYLENVDIAKIENTVETP